MPRIEVSAQTAQDAADLTAVINTARKAEGLMGRLSKAEVVGIAIGEAMEDRTQDLGAAKGAE